MSEATVRDHLYCRSTGSPSSLISSGNTENIN
jgi:hypothetical protein